MKYTVSLLALASLVAGGCQSHPHGHDLGPIFAPGSVHTSIAIGSNVGEIVGVGFDGALNETVDPASLADSTGISFAGSYGTFMTESMEMGASLSYGMHTTELKFSGDIDAGHTLEDAITSEDSTSFSGSAYTRYYIPLACPVLPWVQGNVGYAITDVSEVEADGFFTAGSIGMTYFVDDIHALELSAQLAQTWATDTTADLGVFFGFSVFH